MDTRYDYLSKAKNAIEKAIKPYNENFIAIVLHYLADLKDEQATEYRKHRNKTAKANNKAKIQLTIEQAKEIFANVQSEMVQQMQPARYQSWAKLCLSICLLTGRRIYEICVTGDASIIKHDAIDTKLQPKMMRQFYAAMLKFDIQKQQPNESDNFYDHELAKHLGHNAETDIETVQSYKDIVIHD